MTPLVIVGCGFVGEAVLALARSQGREVWATTRDPGRVAALESLGARVGTLDQTPRLPMDGADVLITYPPDPPADARWSAALSRARRSVYVSSTAVYGTTRGAIDDATPAAPADPRGTARFAAERSFVAQGCVVLRAPGIYGPGRGVHRRLRDGTLRLTGTGDNHLSRIHVGDLAGLCLRALTTGAAGATHVIGDLAPCTQRELVQWLCARLGLELPPSQPPEAAHASLRGDRAVDPRPALAALDAHLRFPTYREGYADVLAHDR